LRSRLMWLIWTMRRIMRSALNYYKCLVCVKEWLIESFAERRVDWNTIMLSKYSKKEDWFRIQFNDEIHFDYESEEQLHIIRQSDISRLAHAFLSNMKDNENTRSWNNWRRDWKELEFTKRIKTTWTRNI
jgi:SNF2 family DNA or RNA helicase